MKVQDYFSFGGGGKGRGAKNILKKYKILVNSIKIKINYTKKKQAQKVPITFLNLFLTG